MHKSVAQTCNSVKFQHPDKGQVPWKAMEEDKPGGEEQTWGVAESRSRARFTFYKGRDREEWMERWRG